MIKCFINDADFLFKETSIYKDLKEFSESDAVACEIDVSEYKNIESARSTYLNSIKRFRLGFRTISKDGRFFLIKKMNEEEA